jgi:hypothetical protein
MADDMALSAMFEYYERGGERAWLMSRRSAGVHVDQADHRPPLATAARDHGRHRRRPGRYSLWLAPLGYRVLHRDVVPLHVDQLRAPIFDSGRTARAASQPIGKLRNDRRYRPGRSCQRRAPPASGDSHLRYGPCPAARMGSATTCHGPHRGPRTRPGLDDGQTSLAH